MNDEIWNYNIFWNEVLKQIREEISDQEYFMWFNSIEYGGSQEFELILRVPSSFYKD